MTRNIILTLITNLTLITILIFPSVSNAGIYKNGMGISGAITRINNAGYHDVYGPVNLSIGVNYDNYFSLRRRLGMELGFRFNYDTGETTYSKDKTTFLALPIFIGIKYRYIVNARWFASMGGGFQWLYYSETIDNEAFEDNNGFNTGIYLLAGLNRKWGRSKYTFFEFRISSNSIEGDGSGAGGKSPDAGSFDFVFGITFSGGR